MLSGLTPDTRHLKPKLFVRTAMFIEIDAGFFDGIECNPIPPDGDFALFTGKLYGCVPMVFVTLIVIRVINIFCHMSSPILVNRFVLKPLLTRIQIQPFSSPTLPRWFVRSGQTLGEK
jgi:hypothetical protein